MSMLKEIKSDYQPHFLYSIYYINILIIKQIYATSKYTNLLDIYKLYLQILLGHLNTTVQKDMKNMQYSITKIT